MSQSEAIDQLKATCNTISAELMKIHPPLNQIESADAKATIIKTSFELTKNIETIKKTLAKLESRDDSPLT